MSSLSEPFENVLISRLDQLNPRLRITRNINFFDTYHCNSVTGQKLCGGQHGEVGKVGQQIDDGHLYKEDMNTFRKRMLATCTRRMVVTYTRNMMAKYTTTIKKRV